MKDKRTKRTKENPKDFLDEITEEREEKSPGFKQLVEDKIKSNAAFRKLIELQKKLSNFSSEEQYILWCAMTAMVNDVHCPQDQMTEVQWNEADQLWNALNNIVEKKS